MTIGEEELRIRECVRIRALGEEGERVGGDEGEGAGIGRRE